MGSTAIFWILVIGIPIYLFFEHPVIFWMVFVPIATISIIKIIAWLKK